MKIDFGNITYFNGINDGKVYDPSKNASLNFNENHFNDLLNSGMYRDAVTYAKQYHMNDFDDDKEYYGYIAELEAVADEMEAKYARIRSNKDLMDKVSFAENIFTDRGLEKLSGNKYADEFKKMKKEIGGINSSMLSITFQPKKQKFGLDFLKRDNNISNVENIYDALGMTEADLRDAGIKIKNDVKTGETTLYFNKSHKLADKILYNTTAINSATSLFDYYNPNYYINRSYQPIIKGYDKNGKSVDYDLSNKNVYNHFINYKTYIENALNAKEEAFKENNNPKQYNTFVGPALSDELDNYTTAYLNGEIDPQKYYNYRKKILGGLDEVVRSIGVENYEIYSNVDNDEPTDMTNRLLDTKRKQELQTYLQSIDEKRIHYGTRSVNGKIGLNIIIDPLSAKDADIKSNTDIAKQYRGKTIEIFIPNADFAQNQINKVIQEDTHFRALAKLNHMQDYSYGYTTSDGLEIKPDGTGRFIVTDKNGISEEKTKNEVNNIIELDMGIKDYLTIMPFRYANIMNNAVNSTQYFELSKQAAVKMVSSVYPDIPLIDEYGQPITDINDIFELDLRFIPGDVAKKIQLIRDTYNKLYKGYNYQMSSRLS